MPPIALIEAILAQYALPLSGVHGPVHWARVLANGRRLTKLTGADIEIVSLFAVLHDSRRFNEGRDHGHGNRGAEFAKTQRGKVINLDHERFGLLAEACGGHTDGETEADVTIQTCWDADRLDLGRVGITPNPVLLCTDAARDPAMIAWATERATANYRPAIVDQWL